MLTRTKAIIVAAALAAPFVIPTTVSAADPVGDCQATSPTAVGFPNVGFNAGSAATIVSGNSWYDRYKTVNASLPAGSYDVETTSYDGYTGRTATTVQKYEQYVLEFLDSSGAVIDRTGPTPDLIDGTESAVWHGPVGQVVLDRPATQIRAIHLYPDDAAINAEGGANSVQPSCVGYTPVTTSTTTTVPSDSTTTTVPSDSTTTTVPSDSTTTTVPSDSTTTTVPSDSTTTTVPSDSTTTTIQIAPPTTTSTLPTLTSIPTTTTTTTATTAAPTTTTTTTPVTVLPQVQEVPDPDPVVANPTFTG